MPPIRDGIRRCVTQLCDRVDAAAVANLPALPTPGSARGSPRASCRKRCATAPRIPLARAARGSDHAAGKAASLASALEALPQHQNLAFRLRYLEGRDVGEIPRATEGTVNNAYVTLWRARQAMGLQSPCSERVRSLLERK